MGYPPEQIGLFDGIFNPPRDSGFGYATFMPSFVDLSLSFPTPVHVRYNYHGLS